MGAWPIVGFLGLDIALIWWAMRSSQRDGKRYEEVTLWPDQLELKQVDGTGKETLSRFNPYFVKLVVDRDYNERTVGCISGPATATSCSASSSTRTRKSSFAKAFGTALKRARV